MQRERPGHQREQFAGEPALLHDPVFNLCPRDEGEAWANGEANVSPEEWARVCPHIFGDQAVA